MHSQDIIYDTVYIEVIFLISYAPFYKTLKKKGITTYYLIYKQGVPPNTIQRMKHGKHISTRTIDLLCSILNCEISDLVEYKKDE